MNGNDKAELFRTHPDYVIYVPDGRGTGGLPDVANEHFLVFRRGDGTLAAVWTQSGFEGECNQHIVFASSDSRGRVWSPPRIIAGGSPDPATGRGMCSWGFPLVSRSGRIYVLYSKHMGINDIFTHTTGLLHGIFSDDGGESWSAEETVTLPRTIWDHPDPAVPPNCIVWQKPLRFGDGRYLAGVTRWVSPSRYPGPAEDGWYNDDSVVDFLRFENLDADPDCGDLEITLLTPDEQSLRFPIAGHPERSLVQEPSIVELPDGRLFAVMRSVSGHPVCAQSRDGGEHWSRPEILTYGDGLPPLAHPLSPCPCYRLNETEYLLFFHNHGADFGPWRNHDGRGRRPIYLSLGRFAPGDGQPLRFSAPISLMDSDNVELNRRSDLALYSSFEAVDGRPVLFYPDRKHFLVGRIIGPELLDRAVFP